MTLFPVLPKMTLVSQAFATLSSKGWTPAVKPAPKPKAKPPHPQKEYLRSPSNSRGPSLKVNFCAATERSEYSTSEGEGLKLESRDSALGISLEGFSLPSAIVMPRV